MIASESALLLRKSTTQTAIIVADDPVEVITTQSAAYDLLIIGTSRREDWRSLMRLSSKDVIAEKAACSVLRLTIR